MRRNDVEAQKEQLIRDMNWMHRARGRFTELVGIMAPEVILRNEHACWDRKIKSVRDILAEGKVRLNSEGWADWMGMLEEYLGMPSVEEVLEGRCV